MTLPPQTPPPPDPLELYLDGLLEGVALAAFEAELARNPALRRQVELQSSIDAQLAAGFRPPSAASLPAASFTAGSAPADAIAPGTAPMAGRISPAPSSVGRRLRYYAAAAAILLSLAGSWSVYVNLTAPKFGVVTPQAVYQRLVSSGFNPEFVCTTDEAFVAALVDRFGQGGAVVMEPTPSIELVGWAYANGYEGVTISPDTLVLMARVEGEPVIVLMDKASRDRTLKKPELESLDMFRRTVGGLVLYEVTSVGGPRIIDRLVPARRQDRSPG
ncbi:MAG: hypothetical protein H7Y88_12910 [Phycisphaerales bacterium]|nr:hypothetical protein [Phycisphaerales bacterium]